MPPATRRRAVVQPFTSPSSDFTPMSSLDVEAMLVAAEQSSDSAPTLRRSTRRATLLAKTAVNATEQASTTGRSVAASSRRSTVIAPAVPLKTGGAANRLRLTAVVAANGMRSKQSSSNKENVGTTTSADTTRLPVKATAAIKPLSIEVRRSSRLSSIPVMSAAAAGLNALSRGRHAAGRVQQAANTTADMAAPALTASIEQLVEQPITMEETVDSAPTVELPVKPTPVLPTCNTVVSDFIAAVPPPPPTTASSSPAAVTADLIPPTAGSSLSTARHTRPQPIRAVQLLSPVRPAPLSARSRTHGRVPAVHRRRSASVRRESLLGSRATFEWQAQTPPTDEVRAIARREEEKRRRRAEREAEADRQREEAAERERLQAAEQAQIAVIEADTPQRTSLPSQQPNPATVPPSSSSQATTPLVAAQHSTQDGEAAEMAVVDEHLSEAAGVDADGEGEWRADEKPASRCSIRLVLSTSVSVALIAAIGAVLCWPAEVNSWLS